jgi:hypothetical protein
MLTGPKTQSGRRNTLNKNLSEFGKPDSVF